MMNCTGNTTAQHSRQQARLPNIPVLLSNSLVTSAQITPHRQTWFLPAFTFLTAPTGMWALASSHRISIQHSTLHWAGLNGIIADSAGGTGGLGGSSSQSSPGLLEVTVTQRVGGQTAQHCQQSKASGQLSEVSEVSEHKYSFDTGGWGWYSMLDRFKNIKFVAVLVHFEVHRSWVFLKIAWSWLASPETSRLGWL